MPTVPVYGQRKVGTDPYPEARRRATLTEEAAGVGVEQARAGRERELGQLGGELANAGFVINDAQQKARQRADDMAATMADNELARWMVHRLNDPQTGALNVRGMNAMNLPEQLESEFGEVAGEIEKTLTTPRQKAAFEQAKARRGLSMLETISQHTSREITRAEQEALATTITNTQAIVAANASNPQLVAGEIDTAAAAIRTHGKNMGWDLDTIEAKIGDMESMGFTTAVETLVDQGNTKAAKIYFEEVGSRISDPKDRSRLQKMLATQTDLEEALAQGDAIIDQGGSETDMLKAARAYGKEHPEQREKVEQRIGQHWDRQRQAERQQQETLLDQAYNHIRNGGTVSSLPASTRQILGSHLPALDSYEKQRNQSGGVAEDDLNVWTDMWEHAQREPANFKTLNLRPLQSKLTPASYKRLLDLQMDMRNAQPKAAKALQEFSSREQVFDSVMQSYGINVSAVKPDTPEANAINQVRRMLGARVEAAQTEGKPPLSNQEITEQLDAIMSAEWGKKGSILGGLYYGWSGVPLTDQTKRLIDVTYDEIPAAKKIEVENELRRQRRPVTPVTVRDFFIEMELDKRAQQKAGR